MIKRIKRLCFILIYIIFTLPIFVHAGTELGTSTMYPVVGSSFYIQLDLMYCESSVQDCSKFNIRDFHSQITYDTSVFEFEKVVWIQSPGDYRDNGYGTIYIDKEAGRDWTNGPALQLKFTVKKSALSEIGIDRNGESHYTDGNIIGQSFANIYINAKEPNEYTRLSGLYIYNYDIQPTFNKMHNDYTLNVPANVSSIKVVAQKGDPTQTITGDGSHALQYGENKIHVVVKAQDGSTNTYNINVIRTDNRTGDTSLKTLTVGETIIPIKENIYSYETTVSKSVESLVLSANTTDSNATLIGTGRKNLNIGNNIFTLTVESSNGKKSEYTINVIRSTENFNVADRSNKLRDIKVNGIDLDLSNNRTEWFYSINSTVTELSIAAITESKTAVIEVSGNKELKSGINIIEIKVTEMKDVTETKPATKADETIYTLVVYKSPIGSLLINELKIPEKYETDLFYRTTNEEDTIINKELLNSLNKNKKNLYYNIVNEYNGILYQIVIPGFKATADLDVSFKKTSSTTYETNLPEGYEILLNVRETYQNNVNVKIYTYNEANKYNLLTDGLTVQDGYIRFTTNGDNNYVITTASLIAEEGPLEIWFKKNKSIIFGIIGIFIFIIISVFLFNKFKKKTKADELQY